MRRRQFLSHFGTYVAIAAMTRGSSAQTRRFAEIPLRGTRHAADYGVTADTAGDQSARFQSMIEAAANERHALYLPAGHYFLAGIKLPSDITLEGVPGQTRLVHSGGRFLSAGRANNIVLRGLVLESVSVAGADGVEGLVELNDVQNFALEDCEFRRAPQSAVRLTGCGGLISGNKITDAGDAAIYATDGTGLSVTENTIERCGNGGVIIYRSEPGHDGTTVSRNRIRKTGATNGGTGQWGNAINFFRADNVVARDNTISDSAFTAIRGNTVHNMQVIGNTCTGSGETAIYAEFAYQNATIENNIVDGAANGISAPNLDHGGHGAKISGNVVRNLQTTAPYEVDFPAFGTGIGVEADAIVHDNLIENAPLYGINAGWGPYLRNVTIEGNTIRNARFGIGVSAVEGAGRATIRDNTIGARETGILPHAWGKPVAPDLLADPDAAPPNVSVRGNIAASG
ncbi:MAG: TIGR03808 family TAT-translocated repetitive protein [Oricola sp.]